MAIIKKTQDGRSIVLEIIEIISFPDNEMVDKEIVNSQSAALKFLQLIKAFRTVYSDNSAVFEILWVTRPVYGQAYSSEIKIYLLLRKIGSSEEMLEANLETLRENMCSLLKIENYVLRVLDETSELKKDLLTIDNECVYALKKKEKYSINTSTQSMLFYNDILENKDYNSFDNLILRLSEMRDCAISFQILPTQIGIQDQILVSEVANLYHNISNGSYLGGQINSDITMIAPIKCIDAYYNSLQGELFNYNIVVLGSKKNTESIINPIISLLKCDNNKKADFELIDLSILRIKLYSDIFTYVWNILSYVTNVGVNIPCANSTQVIMRKLSLMMSDKELLNFFRLPTHSKNTLALNTGDVFNITEQIDESLLDADNIKFGSANTINGQIEIGCAKEQFSKHALIVGTPGTGKTTFSLNLLLQFYRKNVPFLAIEPTKTEYRALIEKIPDIQIFTPGNNEISPFIINPFVPPKGIKVEQYIPALVSAFGAAFSMESPLDVIFLKAIRTSYTEYGWKDYSRLGDSDVKEFGLYEFILIFKRIIKESQYSRDVKGNLESGGVFRLMNLIEQNGNIYDTVKNVPIEDILAKPTVLELNSIQDGNQKALIIALLLSTICLYTKIMQSGDGKLKNVILIDEAHVLLNGDTKMHSEEQSNPKGTTIESLKAMIAEIRSYGTGLIIADQSAKKVSRDIVANTDIKIVFRLVEKEEKEIISNSINADSRVTDKISKLKMGEAFIFMSKLDGPQLVQTPDVRKIESIKIVVSDEEISSKMQYWKLHKDLLKPFYECKYCKECIEGCDYFIRSDANYHASRIYSNRVLQLTDKVEFARHLKGIDVLINNALQNYPVNKRERLIKCCTIQLRRKVQLETNLSISEKELVAIISR